MRIRRLRQILKSFADETRLRIINLLNKKDLTVSELCDILNKNQSNISRHLARMRLTEVVGDRREGLNVYYYLTKPNNGTYKKLLDAIIVGFSDVDIFKEDLKRLKEHKKKSLRQRKNYINNKTNANII